MPIANPILEDKKKQNEYCKKCYEGNPVLSPKLIQSGRGHPKERICPICDTFHSKDGRLSEDVENEAVEERMRKIYGDWNN